MKTKLIYSDFDPELGESVALIESKYGNFYGFAQCHPDEDKPSPFVGCEIAEVRARMNVITCQIEDKRLKIKGLNELEDLLRQKPNCNYKSAEWRALRKYRYVLQDEIDNLIGCKKAMKAAIYRKLDAREEFYKRVMAKKNKGE